MPTTYVSRISTWIEKRFNAKGGNVITDIDPTALVHLIFQSGNEDRYLQGWNRFFMQFLTTAVAAQNSGIQLRNPAGSNCVIVMERWLIYPAVATTSNFAISQQRAFTSDLTTPGVGIAMDNRTNQNSVGIPSFTSNATNLANVVVQFHANDLNRFEAIQTVNQEITLLPGDAVRVTDSTVNEAMDASMWWRERALELSELT